MPFIENEPVDTILLEKIFCVEEGVRFDERVRQSLERGAGSVLCRVSGVFFPTIHGLIDWSQAPRMLDKEFQQITPLSELGRRAVDKLVEVRLLSGEVEWILIHLEIQNQWIGDFSQRMFVYFYRIRDKYNQRVVSLAVLGDENSNWRPSRFQQETLGCRVEFSYPLIKLNDFLSDLRPLETSSNPVASLILAHLMAMQTTGKPVHRFNEKLRLLRILYDRGVDFQVLRQLFRVIDWMLELPPELEHSFREELRKIEETRKMPYITSVERLAREEGREEGLEHGIACRKDSGSAADAESAATLQLRSC